MHLTDDELVLHYYGEMSEAGEARACAHLEACAACRANLAALQRVMAAVDAVPAGEPDAWFEQRTWARLEPALGRQPRPAPGVEARPAPGATIGRWHAVAWGALAALIVIAAFVAGRFAPVGSPPPQSADAQRPSVRERILLVDLGDHLDRTETALVEFVSGGEARDVTRGSPRAEDLVAANRLYRRSAVATGDQAVADVLDDLERVLIEIAGAAPESSIDDLDAVRRRIDTRGLLFKVRVMREQLQERARSAVQSEKRDTTL